MTFLNKYRDLGAKYIFPIEHTNPAKIGHVRRLCVLYVIGRFGFSSKIVFEYLLKLPREAINKLFRKLVSEGFINERKSFGSKDGAVYYLSSKGKRYLAYEADLDCNQKTDTSSHNSKTEIHDLSIQICVIDRLLNSNGQYTAFVTEKELREIGYGTHSDLKHERAVDALLYFDDGQANDLAWHALEVETANTKNKATVKLDLRSEILEKYLNQLGSDSGLYQRVLFFSHRDRFLRQIKVRHESIILEDKLNLTPEQKNIIAKNLKYIHSFCPTLYNIFWEPGFKLEKATHKSVELANIPVLVNKLLANPSNNQDFIKGYNAALKDLDLTHIDPN